MNERGLASEDNIARSRFLEEATTFASIRVPSLATISILRASRTICSAVNTFPLPLINVPLPVESCASGAFGSGGVVRGGPVGAGGMAGADGVLATMSTKTLFS